MEKVDVFGVPFNIKKKMTQQWVIIEVVDCPGFDEWLEKNHGLDKIVGDDDDSAMSKAKNLLAMYTQVKVRSVHQRKVDKFMRMLVDAGKDQNKGLFKSLPLKPISEMSFDVKKRRARLILEEAVMELIGEGLKLNLSVRRDGVEIPLTLEDISFVESGPGVDLVKLLDGALDSKVVITGTLSEAGIPDGAQDLVDDNNLNKFAFDKQGKPKWKIREDGKLIKPEDHVPPDLQKWLTEVAR